MSTHSKIPIYVNIGQEKCKEKKDKDGMQREGRERGSQRVAYVRIGLCRSDKTWKIHFFIKEITGRDGKDLWPVS